MSAPSLAPAPMCASMRSRWIDEITGPTMVSSSSGSPTFMLPATAASLSTSSSYLLRCTIARVGAVQIWPLWKPQTLAMAVTAPVMSASSSTSAAPLPPSSSSMRFIVGAPAS